MKIPGTSTSGNWLAFGLWLVGFGLGAVEVPAGQLLEVRLRQGLSSYATTVGQEVEGVLVAPVLTAGRVAIPSGSVMSGRVIGVRRVGLGFLHERALLQLQFDRLTLPGRPALRVRSRLFQIENSREILDSSGRVKGIRSTNTPGFRAAGVLTGLAAVDPIALLFSTAAFTSTLRFSEPEIHWRAGAELILELTEGIDIGETLEVSTPAVTRDPNERAELVQLVSTLPHRTSKVSDGALSDLTNVLLIGKPEAIARAFEAAGWVESQMANAHTRYRSLRAFAENQPYQEAPMSELALDGEEAVLTLSKTLNTFTRRHHLRLYAWKQSWDGQPIFQAAATHDTDIVVSWRKHAITHRIDSNIDDERAKVLNDLMFTGCVAGAEWVARPKVGGVLANGSGQSIETDRSIAVLRLNSCKAPEDGGVLNHEPTVAGPNGAQRTARQVVLRMRNDVLRGNLLWQGASWAYQFGRMLRRNPKMVVKRYERTTLLSPTGALTASAFQSDGEDGGSMIAPLSERPVLRKTESTLGGDHRWGTPSVELGFNLGTSMFCQSTVGEEAWIFSKTHTPDGPVMNVSLTAGNQIQPGWAVGGSVTVHGTRWISNELGFHYLRGSFLLGLQERGEAVPGLVEQRAGLLTRQFSYNTVFHLRPVESRWRPYLAAGPALQLVHLTDAPFRESKGVFRLGLGNVGMIRSAYNFSSAPPLDGGGIFQMAGQMGGGLKYRYRNCWILRLDYRNTLSKRPDLLRKSLADIVDEVRPIQETRTHAWFAQQRITIGVSFTF